MELVILAQVGHFYFGAVGQYYFGGNMRHWPRGRDRCWINKPKEGRRRHAALKFQISLELSNEGSPSCRGYKTTLSIQGA